MNWAPHLRWVRARDRWVNLLDIGSGPPVLLVHGLGASWQCWMANVEALAGAGHRVVAVDLPGFGHSEMPAEAISISEYARVLDELADELDLGPATVVGNSMGGFVGCELAIAFPMRVERLVLVSAASLWGETRRAAPTVRVARMTRLLNAWGTARVKAAHRRPLMRAFALRQGGIRHPLRVPHEFAFELIDATGREGFLDALGALAGYSVRDRLPEIACPTLVVWGRDDPLVRVSDADEFERLIPDARKIVWDDVGHVAMVERPDAFNRLVIDFVGEAPNADVDEMPAWSAASPG